MITYFLSGRLWIYRAALECEHRSGIRALVPRCSGLLELTLPEFLDGLSHNVESVVVVHPRRQGPTLGSLTSLLSILIVMSASPPL